MHSRRSSRRCSGGCAPAKAPPSTSRCSKHWASGWASPRVLAALSGRLRTGEGAPVDTTICEARGGGMASPAYFTAYGGSAPERSGAHHATIAPYGPFRTGDGSAVFLSVQNEREFARFCEVVLGDAALARDMKFSTSPARLANRAALHENVDRVFSRLTGDEVIARLEAADIAHARLNTMEEFWRHPQLAARERWTSVASPAGPIDALKPPFNLSGFEARMDPVPAVGQHTRALLGELGYAEAEIDRLAARGAVQA